MINWPKGLGMYFICVVPRAMGVIPCTTERKGRRDRA